MPKLKQINKETKWHKIHIFNFLGMHFLCHMCSKLCFNSSMRGTENKYFCGISTEIILALNPKMQVTMTELKNPKFERIIWGVAAVAVIDQPLFARSMAVSLPIPVLAPVMTTVLSSSLSAEDQGVRKKFLGYWEITVAKPCQPEKKWVYYEQWQLKYILVSPNWGKEKRLLSFYVSTNLLIKLFKNILA